MDVLVVGAGPAGGRLAWRLALAGVSVLVVDRLADLGQAAFSSAALPDAALQEFDLPEAVIAARWRAWHLVGPAGRVHEWWADRPLGAVLDFGALRRWQASRAAAAGAELRLGWRAVASGACGGHGLRTWLQKAGDASVHSVRSRFVVDATGEARALLGEPSAAAAPLVQGLGVEWLLQVDAQTWQQWAERLGFFLGSGWVHQGYGWVFPMGPGQLKVGVCRLQADAAGESGPSLGRELAALLQRLGLAAARVLDRHGGRIRSTIARREAHGEGRLIGLGDAVSTANLLGGEGIRHAMTSAEVLAPLLLEHLQAQVQRQRFGFSPEPLLAAYTSRLRQRLGWRWGLSGRLARRTWLGLRDSQADRRLERLLEGLQQKRAEDLSALLFDYRFERYGLQALPYALGWR